MSLWPVYVWKLLLNHISINSVWGTERLLLSIYNFSRFPLPSDLPIDHIPPTNKISDFCGHDDDDDVDATPRLTF